MHSHACMHPTGPVSHACIASLRPPMHAPDPASLPACLPRSRSFSPAHTTVYASDAGLTTRTASGPAINYDDPDAYWDQLEGEGASRTTTPPFEFLPIKYVEAAAGPSVVADLADLNKDVRGLSENYRDLAGAIQQGKAAGEDCVGCPASWAGLPGAVV